MPRRYKIGVGEMREISGLDKLIFSGVISGPPSKEVRDSFGELSYRTLPGDTFGLTTLVKNEGFVQINYSRYESIGETISVLNHKFKVIRVNEDEVVLEEAA
jgi:hypothetical protein